MVLVSGSPDENARELSEMVRTFIAPSKVPAVFAPGFSDVRGYEAHFLGLFRNVHFYRLINPVTFPSIEVYAEYLETTPLVQALEPEEAEEFLQRCRKRLWGSRNLTLTKIVDVLRASKKK